jgi:hypothetical protein
MRKLFVAIILLCIAYFLGGWVGISFGWLSKEEYFAYAGIVGGLASVAGLFALTRPTLSKADVQAIELESLKSMTKTAEELQNLEEARARAKGELGNLEIKKKEMELLVKKASLALFLKEQYEHYEKQVLDEVAKNSQLRESLEKAAGASIKLKALDEEISSHPDVAQLREVISSASRREPTLEDIVEALPFPLRPLFGASRLLAEMASSIRFK